MCFHAVRCRVPMNHYSLLYFLPNMGLQLHPVRRGSEKSAVERHWLITALCHGKKQRFNSKRKSPKAYCFGISLHAGKGRRQKHDLSFTLRFMKQCVLKVFFFSFVIINVYENLLTDKERAENKPRLWVVCFFNNCLNVNCCKCKSTCFLLIENISVVYTCRACVQTSLAFWTCSAK